MFILNSTENRKLNFRKWKDASSTQIQKTQIKNESIDPLFELRRSGGMMQEERDQVILECLRVAKNQQEKIAQKRQHEDEKTRNAKNGRKLQ